ncbi:hypothetical protein ACFL4G_00950 [Thermodesulfobacteriota bacterium]
MIKRRILNRLAALFLGLWTIAGCSGSDGKDIVELDVELDVELYEEDFRLIASEGIDERRNSYPWAMEQFDGDGDGTPEIYIGTINNALCHQWVPTSYKNPPPERWQCPNEFWDPEEWESYVEGATGPAYVYQGRVDERTGAWSWQRVWEPDFDTEVFGFRGARVFNDALYMLSNHETGPTVWKTTDGIQYDRASPPGLGAFEGGIIPPGFRGAQVFGDRLCIASDTESVIYCSSDPSTDPDSWEQINSTGFLASGGRVHEQVYSLGKVSSATASTLTDESKTWYPMAQAGKLVRITVGTGAGQSAQILSNDLRTLTIDGTWETIPDCTSRFETYQLEVPDSGRIWQMAPFNDHLYAIAFNVGGEGPTLWKSADPAPGNWTRVIEGGFGNPSIGFMTLRPFRDHLYIGTGTYPTLFILGSGLQGCEILRIDAEDNVELVIGKAREAGEVGPDPVEPISGLGRGFGHLVNFYLWYMGEHQGWLYVCTADFGGLGWDLFEDRVSEEPSPDLKCRFDSHFGPPGFDMWRTQDGVEWFKVTDDGFGEHDNYGGRNLMSTQWGFFVGVPNAVDGFQIWLGKEE